MHRAGAVRPRPYNAGVRRTFQLALPNGPLGDPLLVARPRLAPRTLLLDAGDTAALGARALLSVGEVLVSHPHVDHVFGLARLLRVRLGRTDRPLRLFGPPGLAAHVRSHLGGYAWNLVDAFPLDLGVVEVHRDRCVAWRFPASGGFDPYVESSTPFVAGGVVFGDELLEIAALTLDHGGIPSIAWRVREHRALNVDAARLAEAGLPAGPWLADLKQRVRENAPGAAPVLLPDGRSVPLAELRALVLRESEGDSIAYATDVAPTGATREALVRFAGGVRRFVLEAHFLDEDRELAERHGHLTAALAGTIVREAAPGSASPLHVSSRYAERLEAVLDEFATGAGAVPVEPLPSTPLADEP